MPELLASYRELGRLATRQARSKEAEAYYEHAFKALRMVKPNSIVAVLHSVNLVGLSRQGCRKLNGDTQLISLQLPHKCAVSGG
jgi:hypothetical protein